MGSQTEYAHAHECYALSQPITTPTSEEWVEPTKEKNPTQKDQALSRFQPKVLEFRGLSLDTSGDTGLVSAGRTDKGTPPLTTPGHSSKSSAMDVSPHIF